MVDAKIFETPWGWMGIAASNMGICRIVLPCASRHAVEMHLLPQARSSGHHPSSLTTDSLPGATTVLLTSHAQLTEFLDGTRRMLDFPLDLSCGSPFQRRVWQMTRRIPYGRVRSYKWVATRVGGRHYARAVGLALGANPVPLIVPCHRVVAHDGSLGGFSGGLRVKRHLLELEGTLPQLGG
jgi:O-6-methylguanine DNA methyltransferase